MKGWVVDASVVLKWYLQDEEFGETALDLLHTFVTGKIDLLAPGLLEYEVANGLLIACRKGRIEEETAVSAMEAFADLDLRLVSIFGLYREVIAYSKKYGRTAYDGSYLAVAGNEGIGLITADERLYNSVKKDLEWVKWLGEWKPDNFGI